MKKLFIIFVIPFVLFSPLAMADSAALDEAKKNAQRLFPGEPSYKVSGTEVPGLYQVEFNDGFVYITSDGKFAVKGEIIDVEKNYSITEYKQSQARNLIMSKIPENEMLVYSPKDDNYKYTINVFTDIDCSYCRVMHQQMQKYLDRDIRVRYVFYPRAGKGTPSYKKAVNVWCNEDSHKAMTMAKLGKPVEDKSCDNPVDSHIDVARQLGVTGTPTIIIDDGGRLPGFVPPDRLWLELEKRRATARRIQN